MSIQYAMGKAPRTCKSKLITHFQSKNPTKEKLRNLCGQCSGGCTEMASEATRVQLRRLRKRGIGDYATQTEKTKQIKLKKEVKLKDVASPSFVYCAPNERSILHFT